MWNCLFRSTNEIADDQNDQNKINVSITDLNGKGSHIAPEVVEEMKSKFQKHQQILVSNYEQAESEIKRMDEIYHDTISNVLNVRLLNILFNLIKHFTILLFFQTLKELPLDVQNQPKLENLRKDLEREASESLSNLNMSPGSGLACKSTTTIANTPTNNTASSGKQLQINSTFNSDENNLSLWFLWKNQQLTKLPLDFN